MIAYNFRHPPIFEQTNALMKLNKKNCTYVAVLLPEMAAHIQVQKKKSKLCSWKVEKKGDKHESTGHKKTNGLSQKESTTNTNHRADKTWNRATIWKHPTTETLNSSKKESFKPFNATGL